MVLLKEFRIVMPMSLAEYQIAQLYAVAKASNKETKGGEGVEVLLREKAWNAFPYCKTVLTSPFLGERFRFVIETWHVDNDRGTTDNVHKLAPEVLKNLQVAHLDIADNNAINKKDYVEEEDPTKFHSVKANRGPLTEGWQKTCNRVMCAYKLVTVELKWFGLQNKLEKYIMGLEDNIFLKFHRQLFCWMDEWYGMTMNEVREFERKISEEMKLKLEHSANKHSGAASASASEPNTTASEHHKEHDEPKE